MRGVVKTLLVVAALIVNFSSFAQVKDSVERRDFSFSSFFVGYNVKQQSYFELGYLRVKGNERGHHPFGIVKSISSEFKVNPFVVGPKLSLWAYGGGAPVAMGVNLIDYFDTKGNSLFVVRPEIGLGVYGVKITFGWNIYSSTSMPVDRSVFSFQAPLRIRMSK